MKYELNKIYNEDCYEAIKNIPDKSIDLIVTDPPYEIGQGGMTGLFKNRKTKASGHYMTEIMDKNFGLGYDLSLLKEFTRVLKFTNIYIWCNKEQIYDYLNFFVKERNCNFEIFIWEKPTFPPFTCGHFCKDKEYCLYFWEKGKLKLTGSWEDMKTVFHNPVTLYDKKSFLHPTIKPLSAIKKMINASSQAGGGCFGYIYG